MLRQCGQWNHYLGVGLGNRSLKASPGKIRLNWVLKNEQHLAQQRWEGGGI